VYYTKGFSANRKPSKENPSMNKLVSIESGFSLTGANADARMAIQPNDYSAFLSSVLVEVASLKGKSIPSGIQANPNNDHKEIAKQLVAAKSPLIMVGDHLPARLIALGQIINQMLDVVGEDKPLSFSKKYFNSADKTRFTNRIN
jgi:molybdopterin-containing oxidoreductase family iron-sulfur binding subunit